MDTADLNQLMIVKLRKHQQSIKIASSVVLNLFSNTPPL